MSLPVVMIGAGGHARVLLDLLSFQERTILGFTALDGQEAGLLQHGISFLGGDSVILRYAPDGVELVLAVGTTGRSDLRKRLYDEYREEGYDFVSLVHPSSIVSASARLGRGVQLLAGSVVQTGTVVGDNVIVNTKASIDHDCVIGNHVHVAPGATLCGGVSVGEATHIGAGATVIQGVSIGRNCRIGAATLVLRDTPDNSTLIGVPGKVVTS